MALGGHTSGSGKDKIDKFKNEQISLSFNKVTRFLGTVIGWCYKFFIL
jgi:hypothetical protein